MEILIQIKKVKSQYEKNLGLVQKEYVDTV